MKKFKFNFGFLDRFKKKPTSTNDSEEFIENDEESEFDSDESPEDFAEKTLGGFNVNKYREQLQDAARESLEKNSLEQFDENENEENDITNKSFSFQEMELPGKPDSLKKFKFKFPKFNRSEATSRIKSKFAGKSPMSSLEKFSWNDFVLRLFSPYSRARIHSVFIILLVITATYMVGKNIALFFNKAPPIVKTKTNQIPMERADTTLQDINKISSINLFNAKESDKAKDNTSSKRDIESIVCTTADKPTALQIKLLDTIVLQDSVKSVASVQVRGSSELMNVREGEHLEEMAEVSKINRMKLILKNLQTGDCEYAMTDAEAEAPMPPLHIISAKAGQRIFKSMNPNIKNSGNSFKIKRAFRDSLINNMSDVLTQAKAIQITNPDGSLCFKMTEITAGSLYTQLNIQENDIICNINGKKIENLNELMGLLGRIKEIDQFQIGLKRNGMPENLDYGFE
jgi:type II secretory pathway component PulC